MTCPSCSAENRAGRKFCVECGAALALKCPACGSPHEAGEKFCGECGGALIARPAPVPSPADAPSRRAHATDRAEARKVVTIIFADLIGSTSLHERLDAESVTRLMDHYYRAMRGAVETHDGTVVKLMGDGVMAAFGVPRVAEDDAIRAVRAGVAMQDTFRELARNEFAAVGDIGLRVGINTGEVVVSADNTDVVGDPVNVAARLQTEAHDGEVVIGESTRRLVAALVTLAPLGSFALKGRSEAMRAYRVESLERPVGTATAAFVGRDDELGRIAAVYDAALATPAARLAVLLGSPGLGKSRMIEEFARRLGDVATVLTAQCDAAGGATFAPLAEALRELLSAHRDQVPLLTKEGSGEVGQPARQPPPSPLLSKDGEGQQPQRSDPPVTSGNAPGGGGAAENLRAAIEAAVPGIDTERTRIVAGITALLAGSPASPEETFFVIRRFLAALASAQPVVLVIDDLQWAEPLLLDLVEHLVQWGSGVPLLVLVGARPELRDLRSSLVTPGGLVADVLTLAGLDAGAAMRLAANVIGAADLPAAVAAKVLATSEGNPLFVGELVRMLVQEGGLTKDGDRWIPGVALAALEMPPTIQALLAARLERLRPEERSVLERAAVVGRQFSRSAVAELLPRDVVDLDARLEALRRGELIERDTGWFLGEPGLRFHHLLIRDAAYRRLLKGTRAELHARFADWVTAHAGDAVDHDETIGWHLEQAHQLLHELGPLDAAGRALGERAARHLAAAGRRALARDDLPVAADLLGRAVDRLDVDDAARADLALDWCEALLSAGDVGPAAKAIDELGRFIGDSDAEQILAPSPTHPLSVGEGGGEGTSGGGAGAAHTSNTLTLLSPALNRRAGEDSMRLRAWHTCFKGQLTVLTAPQGLQAAADAVAGAAEELAKLGDAAGEAKAHSVHATALARLGKVGACEAALDQALAAARRGGDRRRANAVLAGAPLAALWGPSPVTRASGRCLDVVRVLRITQGAPAVESVALSCQGVLEALRGRTEAARRMLASSRKMVEDLGIAPRLFEADAFAGRIAAMDGDAAGAERLLRSAYEGLRELGLGIDAARAGALLARTLLAQDRVAEAESLSHESERLAGDDLQAAIAWRGVRAEALAKRGEHAEAVELARAAVAIASTTDALLDHADACMALAAALRAAGRGTEADAEERRAIELWEAKGATLLAERVRSDRERAAPTVPAAAPIATTTAVRRRVRPNAATAMQNRFDAALAARDFDAIATHFREDHQEIDHPTGSTYGRDACIASLQRLFRSRDPRYEVEPLATVGKFLLLVRRRSSASGAASGPYDVGAYENEAIQLFEVDESGLCARAEVFAADRLGNAIARLYERYAELLPDGPERERATATARSFGVPLTAPGDIDGYATVIAPDFESVDHRHLSTWSMRGGGAFLAHNRALHEVAADVVIGTHDVLALGPNALLTQRLHSGTERLGGGAYERPFLVLFATDSDGRLARAEWFDADREAAALARFEALVGAEAPPPVRRRVRANAATRQLEREWAAIEARDVDALTAVNSGQMEVIHHPTGSTYGAPGIVAMHRGLWRAKNLELGQEVLATLGDSLALVWRSYSHDGVEAKFGSVGPVEVEIVGVFEIDERTQAKRSEIFAGDHLGEAITRLYQRYAELLPEGPERARAAATTRSVRVVAPGGFDLDGYTEVFRSDIAIVDHRVLGWGSSIEPQILFRGMAAAREVGDQLMSRPQDVLALTHDALLLRWLASGVGRESGGAFEWAFLRLFIFDPDGRVARYELFGADREAEALARFEELVAGAEPKCPVRRRLRPNAANAAVARFSAAFAARDTAAVEAMHGDRVEGTDHRWHTTYGRDGVLKSLRGLMKPQAAELRFEPIATLGERLSLDRYFYTSQGGTAGLFDIGENASEYVRLVEVDPFGLIQRVEIFAIDRLDAAVARLYQRYAELLPEGPERERAAATARSVAVWCSPPDADRLAIAMSPSVENADHRSLGTWSARGPEDYLEHWRVQAELAAGWALRDDAVLALEPNAFLVRRVYFGTVRSTGGAFENLLLALLVFGNDGLVTRTEVWEPDCEAEALARFDELSETSEHLAFPLLSKEGARGRLLTRHFETAPDPFLVRRGTPSEPFANAASRTDSELFRCFNGRDWEGVLACVAPVMVFDERRRLVRNTCGRDVWLEQFRFLFDVPKSRFTSRLRATRGERLALNFHRFEGEVAEGGGPLAMEDHLALHEVDADGRIVGLVLFDLEDEEAAHAELDARFEAGEASAYPRVTGALATNRLMQARDWRAYAARLAPGFVYRDHRRLGWGDAGHDSETLIRIQQSAVDLSPDARYRADHVRLSARGILRQATLLGTRDGGAFENPMFIVAEVDEQGRVASNDTYDIEDRDGALARLAELADSEADPAPDPFENAAARAERTLMRCFHARDWVGVEACAAADLVFDDRQPLRRLTADKREWRTMLRFLFDVPARRFDTRLLATRGERLSLHANRFEGEVADGGGPLALDDHLALYEVDGDARIVAVVLFAEDDEIAAHAELDARFEAGEACAYPRLTGALATNRFIHARDWRAYAARLAPGFVYRDHRRLGWGDAGHDSETLIRIQQSAVDLSPDARYRADHVRLSARGILRQVTLLGTRDGGAFETPMFMIAEVDEQGRAARNDTYDIADRDGALTRFAELGAPTSAEPHFENAASRAWREVIAAWRGRDLERFAALQPGLLRYRDHRRLFQLDLDREGFLEFTRPLLTMRSASAELELLATRGERLALMRFTLEMEDEVVGPSAIDSLLLIETDERGAITAYDRYEVDDQEAARAEIQARWETGEGAAHTHAAAWNAGFDAAVDRRDWVAAASFFAPAFVGNDERLAGWGTLHGPAGFLVAAKTMVELAPDVQTRTQHLRTSSRALLQDKVWFGTRDGGAFESPFVGVIELDGDGRALRMDLYDPHHLDRARARFDEIRDREAPAPSAASTASNAATAAIERMWGFDVGDPDVALEAFDAARAFFAPDFVWEDRRPMMGLSGDLDLMIASMRERVASGARLERRTIVGTAGDHVAIARVLWGGGPPEGRFEVEFLVVHEVNEAGLHTAIVFFAPDDTRAAQREAWTRWAAIDPAAAPWVELVNEFTDAWNGHDRARVRACLADDFVLEDHRHAGLGRIEGAEAYVDSVVVLWDLAPDQRVMVGWSWPVVERHGIVLTGRREGTLAEGGAFANDYVMLRFATGGRFTRWEHFEIAALDAALARFEELRPDPLRIPPNAATRAYDRWYEAVKAGNWDALDALYGASYVFDDRRRLFRETHGREGGVINTRFLFEGGWRPVRTLMATAGERLALQRIVWTTSEAGAVSEIEVLELSELDGEGRFVRVVLFDPDACAAASAELFERYVGSGAGASHEAFDLMRAWNTHDLARMRALLPDDFYLDDHRRTGVGRLDGADAYLASIAAMYQLSHDLRTETLYIVSVAAHGVVWVARWSGTNAEGGEFDAVYVCVGLQRDGRPTGLEIFEIDALDAALARFEECHPARGQDNE